MYNVIYNKYIREIQGQDLYHKLIPRKSLKLKKNNNVLFWDPLLVLMTSGLAFILVSEMVK